MGIDHNFRDFAEQFQTKPEEFSEEVIRPLAMFVDRRFAKVATNTYMQESSDEGRFSERKPPRPKGMTGPIRKVSSRLERAVAATFSDLGGFQTRESQVFINPKVEGIVWTKIISVPYASTHEYGSNHSIRIPTTQKMVSFFWAKAYESAGAFPAGENKWKRFALAAKKKSHFNIDVNIPARPYARPALDDIAPEAKNKGEELIKEFMES